MNTIDSYTRQCIKVSVAQICQVIGWSSIQTTPLEILTDLLQEYMMSLARMTNNYATHYGMNSPGVQHVGLSLKTIGVSFAELAEYMTAVEAPPIHEIPLYPVRRESHLNLLKPGSREVVTRPVHIHEHLPPVHPHLQDDDVKECLSVDTATASEVPSPTSSPKGVFKKPGDPDILRKQRIAAPEEEVRALREITSVMMTTSGFLSPAREGKLPEARTPASSQGTMTTSSQVQTEKQEIPFVFSSKDRKKKKAKENKIKDKETVFSDQEKPSTSKVSKDIKPKLPKVNKTIDRSPSPNLKNISTTSTTNTFLPLSGNVTSTLSVKNLQRKQQSTSPMQVQNISPIKASRPPNIPSEKSNKNDNYIDESKLPSELDKQKMNIFKKISKVKDELDLESDVKEEEKWSGLDEVIDAVSRGTIDIKEELESHVQVPVIKEEPELQIDVVSLVQNRDNFVADHVVAPVESIRPPECKRRKKDKHKDKTEGRHIGGFQEHSTNTNIDLEPKTPIKPLFESIEEHLAKSNLPFPTNELPIHQPTGNLPPFPYYPFPSGVLSHPLIPQGPPVIGPFPPLTTPPGTMEPPPPPPPQTQVIQPRSSSSPQPVINSSSSVMGPPTGITSTATASITTTSPKKKEHKKIKKLKDKLKKKKGKKEKNKAKIKSEKKRLKLEKKEREKEKIKSKKEKKEKKKEKEQLIEEKHETQNVPKITLKLSPVSSHDSPDTCHRKIVIKPVVKKDDDKDTSWTTSATISTVIPATIPKPHKSQKHFTKNTHAATSSLKVDIPKIVPPSVAHSIQHVTTQSRLQEIQSEYICPACNRPDDGSPMIACDSCDLWFHWICVGIQEPPESDWYCRKCTVKMDEASNEKKKKHKRKKTTV